MTLKETFLTGFSQQSNLPTRHQSRPDGVLVMPIEGRGRHLDPNYISTRDRDIYLVEIKFCSDINPQQTLERAHDQHQPLIQRLRTRSLRGISRNNKVTIHHDVKLFEVGSTIYNKYTIIFTKPGHLSAQNAPTTALYCHAIKSLNKITKTKNKVHFENDNSDNGGSEGGALP